MINFVNLTAIKKGNLNAPCPGQVNTVILSQLNKTCGEKDPLKSILDQRVQHLRDVYCFGKEGSTNKGTEILEPSKTLGAKWREVSFGDNKKHFQLMRNDYICWAMPPTQRLIFDATSKMVTLESDPSEFSLFCPEQTITQDAEGTITHS